jgi:hypothetical protein
MLDNNELPDKGYKNSDNGGNMTQNDVSFNWRDIIPTLLQTLQRHLIKLSWVLEDRNKLGRELGICDLGHVTLWKFAIRLLFPSGTIETPLS